MRNEGDGQLIAKLSAIPGWFGRQTPAPVE
jgi:hypothetical protein